MAGQDFDHRHRHCMGTHKPKHNPKISTAPAEAYGADDIKTRISQMIV